MTAVDVRGQVAPDQPARISRLHRPRGRRRSMSGLIGLIGLIKGLVPLALLLALWQVLGDQDSTNYPPPSKWWAPVRGLASQGTLWPMLRKTLVAFLLALAIATVLGAAIGLLVGRVRPADRALGPSFEFFRTLPAAAVLPVFSLVLGYTFTMKVSLAVFTSLWPVLLSVRTGVRTGGHALLDVADTLGLSRRARLFKVIVPALLPWIASGLRIAAPLTLVVTLLAEMLTGVDGLGVLIINAQDSFLIPQTYGLVLLAGIVALVVNSLVAVFESVVLRRHGVDR